MKIGVIANGDFDLDWGKKQEKLDYMICVDGGANWAYQLGHLPEVIIGDLDSIDPDYLEKFKQAGVNIIHYPNEKDETDLELALDYAIKLADEAREKEVTLLGATGGRIDHFLANIALLIGYANKGYKIIMKDPQHTMWILRNKEIIKGAKGNKLSLIVLSDQAVITAKGLYYPLNKETLLQSTPRGVSNIFAEEEAEIEVSEGWVLVVLLKEAKTA